MPKVTPDSLRSTITEWLEPGERLLQYTVGGLQGHLTDVIVALTDRYVRLGSPEGGTNIPLGNIDEIRWSGLWARLNISATNPRTKLVISLVGAEWKQRAAQLAEEWSAYSAR